MKSDRGLWCVCFLWKLISSMRAHGAYQPAFVDDILVSVHVCVPGCSDVRDRAHPVDW